MTIDIETGDEPDFDSVFSREDTTSHDSEADTVASEATPAAQPRDEQGRFTSLHGHVEQEPQAAQQPQAAPTPEQQVKPDQQAPQVEPLETQQNRHVPLAELRTERQKRQDAERQIAELQGRLKTFEQFQQRPQAPQQQAPREEVPDPYTDPEGYADYRHRQAFVQSREQIANFSEVMARRTFGAELVDKATQWAVQNNVAQHFFYNARDPYGELIDTYKQQQAIARIGSDPDAYEATIRKEEREKVLAELKAGGANGQQQQIFPGSLATATATGRQGGHLDPQTAADSVFSRPDG